MANTGGSIDSCTSKVYSSYTRKYMHAETLADKTIVFSEREVFKVVVMVTQ
jgi:hypothetical protein